MLRSSSRKQAINRRKTGSFAAVLFLFPAEHRKFSGSLAASFAAVLWKFCGSFEAVSCKLKESKRPRPPLALSRAPARLVSFWGFPFPSSYGILFLRTPMAIRALGQPQMPSCEVTGAALSAIRPFAVGEWTAFPGHSAFYDSYDIIGGHMLRGFLFASEGLFSYRGLFFVL